MTNIEKVIANLEARIEEFKKDEDAFAGGIVAGLKYAISIIKIYSGREGD